MFLDEFLSGSEESDADRLLCINEYIHMKSNISSASHVIVNAKIYSEYRR